MTNRNDDPPPAAPLGRRALCISAALTALLLLVHLVLQPLHARGVAQPALASIDAAAQVIEFPGYAAVGVFNHQAVKRIDGARWWISLACNFTLYLAGLVAIAHLTQRRGSSSAPVTSHRDASRRDLFRRTFKLTAGATLGSAMGYSLFVEPRQLTITRRTLPIQNLPPSLQGLRLVQLSDIHHGPWLTLDFVHHIVAQTNALDPDLVLLTGDYVYDSPRYIQPAIAALAELRPRIGTLAVLGNHDWYEGGPLTRFECARHGIPLIDNTRVILTADRKLTRSADVGLCFAGIGDLWEDEPNYDAALAHLPPSMPRLLLSHNPDAAEDPRFLRTRHRVDLMLSGHTHGGQVRLPIVGAPVVPSKYGQKYAAGLVQGPRCPVYVSRGLGLSGLPVRFAVPPEVVLLQLCTA
jgi:predicted MPP superfamily phosphohydrolase